MQVANSQVGRHRRRWAYLCEGGSPDSGFAGTAAEVSVDAGGDALGERAGFAALGARARSQLSTLSPNRAYVVFGYLGVLRDDGKIMCLGLYNQYPVKWVSVVPGQIGRCQNIGQADR